MFSRAGRWRGADGDTLGAVGVTGRALTIVRATMPLRVTALHHVALPVSDLERSRRFYREVLGLSEIERPAAFDFRGAWFALGDGQLHLIERQGGTLRLDKPVDSRDVHFAVHVDDFDATLSQLRAAGYRDDLPADHPLWLKWNRRPNAGFPQIFILDPDRHVIELNAAD